MEVKDVRLPQQLQRAMAAEAEASREARAKVIAAEGEQRASTALKQAAVIMSDTPTALQLRYLQTLTQISAEKHSTIIFPLPMELMGQFGQFVGGMGNQMGQNPMQRNGNQMQTDPNHIQMDLNQMQIALNQMQMQMGQNQIAGVHSGSPADRRQNERRAV